MADLIGGLHLVMTGEVLRLGADETGLTDVQFDISAAGVLTLTPTSGERIKFATDVQVADDLVIDDTLTVTGVSLFTGSAGFGAAASAAVRVLLAAGSASLAPLSFTSGTLLTSPVAGRVEFLTDAYYATITTGAARKKILLSPTDAVGALTNDGAGVLSWAAAGAAAAGTLTGTTLAANVVTSSLTAIGTLVTGAVPYTLLTGSVPTWNQNTTGSAATLTTPRTINGVSFNGSANITVTAAADTLSGSTLAALSGANLVSLSATALSTGNVAYARMPAGSGTWAVGGGGVLTFTGGEIIVADPMIFTVGTMSIAAGLISRTTLDGSDTGVMAIAGGGMNNSTRGAFVTAYGNESAVGILVLGTGAPAASAIWFSLKGSVVAQFTSSNNFALDSGLLVELDGAAGGGDTNLSESSANNLRLKAGGTNYDFNATRLTVPALTVGSLTGILRADSGVVSVATGVGSKSLFDHFADANNGTTVETDLYSDTIPAARLAANGEKLEAVYTGIFTGDATSTQRIRIYFGGTLIFDSGALAIGVATPHWDCFVTIMRVSSSVVRCGVSYTDGFAALPATASYVEVTGLTLANTQVMKITGQAGGAAGLSNQITAKKSHVLWLPAA